MTSTTVALGSDNKADGNASCSRLRARRRRPRSACRRRLGRLPASPPPGADGPPERPYPARHRPRSARRPPPGPPPSAAPLRRIDGLKKPTEKADTVEKKTPGERTKAGKRLLHQRRLRGLGGGGGRPPPHLQTRSTLFRPARSRPPFSSPSLPRQASPPAPSQEVKVKKFKLLSQCLLSLHRLLL